MDSTSLPDRHADPGWRRARIAGVLLGLGLGGFADGIALHQIAQWHNMLSARLPPTTMEAMRTNMTADGWFHAATWTLCLVGVVMLYSAARRGGALPRPRWFVGLLIGGWGAFNLVEGVINHHALALHHVRDLPAHAPLYDYLFLGIGGIGLLTLGWLLTRGADHGAGEERQGAIQLPRDGEPAQVERQGQPLPSG